MKKCPSCNRTYPDDTLAFCLVDGAVLSASYLPTDRQQPPDSTPPQPTVADAGLRSEPQNPTRISTIVAPLPTVPSIDSAATLSQTTEVHASRMASYRGKLLLGFVLVALLSIAGVGWWIWTKSKETPCDLLSEREIESTLGASITREERAKNPYVAEQSDCHFVGTRGGASMYLRVALAIRSTNDEATNLWLDTKKRRETLGPINELSGFGDKAALQEYPINDSIKAMDIFGVKGNMLFEVDWQSPSVDLQTLKTLVSKVVARIH